MISEVLVVLGVVSVATAVVININLFDGNASDGMKYEVADEESVKSCNYQACDQLCRRLGFPGGACVGDRCDCDNFRRADTRRGADALLYLYTDEPDGTNENSKEPRNHVLLEAMDKCSALSCAQKCWRLGFAGGACAGGKCTCNEHLTQQQRRAVHSCSRQACAQVCRGLGYPGGACVSDNCICDNFLVNKTEKSREESLGVCDTAWCAAACRRMGHAGGYCLLTACVCY